MKNAMCFGKTEGKKERKKETRERMKGRERDREGEKKRINPIWEIAKGTRMYILNLLQVYIRHKTRLKHKQRYRDFLMWLLMLPFVWYKNIGLQ